MTKIELSNMRRGAYIMMTMFAGLLSIMTACTDDSVVKESTVPPAGEEITIHATQDATRMDYVDNGADGITMSWSSNDAFSLYNPDNQVAGRFDIDSETIDHHHADFHGTIPAGLEEDNRVLAVYPAGLEVVADKGVVLDLSVQHLLVGDDAVPNTDYQFLVAQANYTSNINLGFSYLTSTLTLDLSFDASTVIKNIYLYAKNGLYNRRYVRFGTGEVSLGRLDRIAATNLPISAVNSLKTNLALFSGKMTSVSLVLETDNGFLVYKTTGEKNLQVGTRYTLTVGGDDWEHVTPLYIRGTVVNGEDSGWDTPIALTPIPHEEGAYEYRGHLHAGEYKILNQKDWDGATTYTVKYDGWLANITDNANATLNGDCDYLYINTSTWKPSMGFSTLSLVGDATPAGWSLDNLSSTQMTAVQDKPFVYTWEGELTADKELKFIAVNGGTSWDVPQYVADDVDDNGHQVIASSGGTYGVSLRPQGTGSGADYKFSVTTSGRYRVELDQIARTVTFTFLTDPENITVGLHTVPATPDADQEMTVYFKADSESDLYGYTGDVYLHTGVISNGVWGHVPAAWDVNLDKCKMAPVAGQDNTWKLVMSPSIRSWYNAGTDAVTQLGFVVRSADGAKNGVGSDVYIPVTDEQAESFLPANPIEQAMPEGLKYGINKIDDNTVTLVLYDKDTNGASHEYAYVIGDMNDWTLANNESSQMYRDNTAGCWWITYSGLEPTKEYAFEYYIGSGNDAFYMADAYTHKILDPNDTYIPESTYPSAKRQYPEKAIGTVATFQLEDPDPYSWTMPDYDIEDSRDMVIYELHLRDFSKTSDLDGAIAHLNYLKALGVDAIELMPTQEFDGNDSWGYNPCFFFAMDKTYGEPNDYKHFVDLCHQAGIAVILDVVYNHATGASPLAKLYWNSSANKTASNNPYFNVDAPHPYSVFHDFNHESPLVRNYVKRSLKYLIEEYKIDGFRFDLAKGMTQTQSDVNTAPNYDQSRFDIWYDYNSYIKDVDPNVMVILELFADDAEENAYDANGIFMWKNCNHAYCQAASGWSDGSDFGAAYKSGGHWVAYQESHDEERTGYQQFAYGYGPLKGLDRMDLRMGELGNNAALFLTVPGPKMIWEFEELGYDTSIMDGGRMGHKAPGWDMLNDTDRAQLYHTYCRLMALRNANEDLFDMSSNFNWNVGVNNWDNGRFMWLDCASPIAKNLVVVANYTDVDGKEMTVYMPHTGTWTNYMTGETFTVGEDKIYHPQVAACNFELYVDSNVVIPAE